MMAGEFRSPDHRIYRSPDLFFRMRSGMVNGWASIPNMRATVTEGVLKLQVSADGLTWHLSRLSPFPKADSYHVGPMCCTPKRSGLKISFSEFRIGPPLNKALHDLS